MYLVLRLSTPVGERTDSGYFISMSNLISSSASFHSFGNQVIRNLSAIFPFMASPVQSEYLFRHPAYLRNIRSECNLFRTSSGDSYPAGDSLHTLEFEYFSYLWFYFGYIHGYSLITFNIFFNSPLLTMMEDANICVIPISQPPIIAPMFRAMLSEGLFKGTVSFPE